MRKSEMAAQSGVGPTTRLLFRADRVLLESWRDATYATEVLDAGSLQTVLARLGHVPPTPNELETAIEVIEDGLMPALRSLPKHSLLTTAGIEFREIAEAAGISSNKPGLDTATVEMLFNRLAEVAYGAPAAHVGIPTSSAFVAALLVLREVMHHGGFESVVIT